MKFKVLIVCAAALTLAGCHTARQDRVLGGAAIGGATGAVIGGVAGGSVGSAVAGGVLGAAAGGLIGAATSPRHCYVETRYGPRRVRC